ncbi:hypothetical protein ADICYQ_0891 [Cyclobacterium qasimii M12-11B]|nr:alpha-L-rhamnosidase C-terminal domain-containing protein [Cyclobacterium qasimii]EPR70895.1 hypothetical protein ADICYQ_0891 [Cyclobacterium qasimii M12-11B]
MPLSFFKGIGGICSIDENLGYKKFIIALSFPSDIEWVEAGIFSPYGTIKVIGNEARKE